MDVDTQKANALAMEHAHLVDRVVRRWHGQDRWLVDDLKQEAFIGLLSAARRYDESRGKFENFAIRRIKGAVYDFLRGFPHPDNRWQPRRATVVTATDAGVEWSDAIENKVSREIDPADAAESNDEVLHILRHLAPRRRYAMLQRCVWGRLHREIGSDLRLKRSSVTCLLSSAAETIRHRNGIAH